MLSDADKSSVLETTTRVVGNEDALSLSGWLLGIKLPETLQQGAIALNFSTKEEVAAELDSLSKHSAALAIALRS